MSNVKTVKGLVKDLRSIRDELNLELQQMSPEQKRAYFEEMRKKLKAKNAKKVVV